MSMSDLLRRLRTIKQVAQETQVLSEASIRWHVFNAKSNGLEHSGAIVRVGRRVYLDAERYGAWLSGNPHNAMPAPKTRRAAA